MRNETTGEQPTAGEWPAPQQQGAAAVGALLGTDTVEVEPRGPGRSHDREVLRRKRRRRGIIAVAVAVALLIGAGYAVVRVLAPLFDRSGEQEEVAADHPGPGHGSVEVVINPGDTGGVIGETLQGAGVVASAQAFATAWTANPDAATIQPGTYQLLLEMKASDALTALLDPARRVSYRVTVQEGLTAAQTYERLSAVTTIPVADIAAAAADPAVGLPAEAGGNIEGWLFPATYQFEPDATAVSMLAEMVAKTVSVLDALQVPPAEREAVLIKASLVEREGRLPEDRAKIARAIENRLARSMNLDIDAALAFGLGKPGTALTNADKETDNPYNLYKVAGLPPGPIAAPSEESIAAVRAPAEGPWLFWVTVNLDTGETLFAETLADHNVNVEKLRAWQAENGG